MKPTIVLVEGIDGSGKSSLVSRLRAHFANRVYVWDRAFGTTWVWQELGRLDESARAPLSELIALAAHFRVMQIVCFCPPLQALRRCSLRGEHDWSLAELTQHDELFSEWARRSGPLVETLNLDTADDVGVKTAVHEAASWVLSQLEGGIA